MNILGVEYEVTEDASIVKDGADGVCLEYSKQIKVVPMCDMLDDTADQQSKRKRYNEVLRHEAIHAFFSESGLDHYSDDEVLVGWLAQQFPKMSQIFEEYDCLK